MPETMIHYPVPDAALDADIAILTPSRLPSGR